MYKEKKNDFRLIVQKPLKSFNQQVKQANMGSQAWVLEDGAEYSESSSN